MLKTGYYNIILTAPARLYNSLSWIWHLSSKKLNASTIFSIALILILGYAIPND